MGYEAGTLAYLGSDKIQTLYQNNIVYFNTFQFDYDPDAQAFFNAAGITNETQQMAVNTLVTSLKNENLWNTFDAIYPMVGGTATSHKYNLINPSDTNGAYRLNFIGNWTHNNDGAKPDGSTAYADTFYNPNTNLTTANGSVSYYSFTSASAAYQAEIGTFSAGKDTLMRILYINGRRYYNWGGGDPNVLVGAATTKGFYITNVQTATTLDGWKDGVEVLNNGVTNNSGLPNYSFYLAAYNSSGTASDLSEKGCSFASIGDTIPSGKEAIFSSIVNTYQINLGRYSY